MNDYGRPGGGAIVAIVMIVVFVAILAACTGGLLR